MSIIRLENMEFYAYHGHFREEQIIGNKFLVDIELETDTTVAEISDQLKDTVNYHQAYVIIQREMHIRSHLLENIAHRIITGLQNELGSKVTRITVKLSKLNPPLGGKTGKVSVTITYP